jgi:PadR family transcriptional regulator PadR
VGGEERPQEGCAQNFIASTSYLSYYAEEMPQAPTLGEFEQIVLLAILRVGVDAYGISIRAEIEARTGRDPSAGALYTTLDRLEDKGFVTSRVGDPTPKRGGRAKRYFCVTSGGVDAVACAQRAYQSLLDGLVLPGALHA